MKTLTCDLCDHQESGETFDDWMEAMKPHYAEAHTDFMLEKVQRPPEEQMAEVQKWMGTNKERFEAA